MISIAIAAIATQNFVFASSDMLVNRTETARLLAAGCEVGELHLRRPERTTLLPLVVRMPKYRFNLEDHHVIADRKLHNCIDQHHAEEIANEIADQLVQNEPHLMQGDHRIVVRDEDNTEIYRAWIRPRSRPGVRGTEKRREANHPSRDYVESIRSVATIAPRKRISNGCDL